MCCPYGRGGEAGTRNAACGGRVAPVDLATEVAEILRSVLTDGVVFFVNVDDLQDVSTAACRAHGGGEEAFGVEE